LSGPEEFAELRPGEVLVAAITTPAWTSLFAMASAVVTDIGGPLSHSSIVAREYGIPAVLGTAVATRRISSGDVITVDGDAGTVALNVDGPGKGSAGAPEDVQPAATEGHPVRRLWPVAAAAAGMVAAVVALRRFRQSGR
jgi:rifampicin phosphotransferase